MLFADVKGSMDLAEQHDPEEWRRIMQGFFSILSDEVRRFEGTVDKFTGDGIMAVFGAPVAHEDHAQRACLAALRMLDDIADYAGELRRKHGLNFSARIGINSGEVIAGAIGPGGDGEYTAIGHTVGLAQRMEALAEPGKAYLTEATAELARGFLELEGLGEFEIKGASRPVRVFELAGVGAARSRLDRSRERGFSRFVGRAGEMAVLEAGLERAREGEGAVVGIVAEPGIGKSRLCHEFVSAGRGATGSRSSRLRRRHTGARSRSCRCCRCCAPTSASATATAERLVREKIAGRALLLDPEFADDLPVLFDFLGVPDPARPAPQLSAEARQRALKVIVCHLVRAPKRQEPVVCVIEDLHWLDEGSAAMLGELFAAVEGTPTLVVVNFRPEYEHAWTGPPDYHEIALEPLGPHDTTELLRDLAGEDPSLDGLAELIHERTAGNPFFIEEIVRDLAESGDLEGERGAYRLAGPLADSGVPSSVQTVLAARIDRLGPEAKLLLQEASVVGKEVRERGLALISGREERECVAPLRELIEAGFLYEAEAYPERVLAFRHPLTREVAYGSQLGEQRAATHAAVARATIELNPDRQDELAALIANHFEAGGETLEAARWSARAAYWAGSSHPADALRLWRRTMELAGELPEGEEADALAVTSRLLQLQYAWRLGMDSDEEARLAAEAEEIAARRGDVHSLAMLKMATAARPGFDHRADEWLAAAREVNRLADESARSAAASRAPGRRLVRPPLRGRLRRLRERTRPGAGAGRRRPWRWGRDCDRQPDRLGELMGKGLAARERGRLEEAEELFKPGAEDRHGGRRSRDGELDPRQPLAAADRCRETSQADWRWHGATSS